MKRLEYLTVDRLVDFANRPGLSVLFLSFHDRHRFNRYLDAAALVDAADTVALGRLPLADLLAPPGPALAFLQRQLSAAGISVPFAVPPGYYLFREGALIGWDAGLPAVADGEAILRRSMLGAAISLVTRNASFVGAALMVAAERTAAERMARMFRAAAARARSGTGHEEAGGEVHPDELAAACRVLGIAPNTSKDVVNEAWRELMRKHHPDRVARDPEAFVRLSRRCAEINRARHVILLHLRHTA